jgi:hypothetical protein
MSGGSIKDRKRITYAILGRDTERCLWSSASLPAQVTV